MPGRTWYVEVDFVSGHSLTEDDEWDIIESLARHAGLSAAHFDHRCVSLSFTIQARNASTAAACAENAAVCLKDQLGDIRVTGLRVTPQNTGSSFLYDNISMPDLVGHDEILRLCHGHLWFGIDDTQKKSFPRPAVSTGAGHLWVRSEVMDWIAAGPHPS